MLLLMLKGKVQFTDPGWLYFLDALTPILPLLQCLTDPETPLGDAIFKMLDPDVALNIKLSFSEVWQKLFENIVSILVSDLNIQLKK